MHCTSSHEFKVTLVDPNIDSFMIREATLLSRRIVYKLDGHSRVVAQSFAHSRDTVALRQSTRVDSRSRAIDGRPKAHSRFRCTRPRSFSARAARTHIVIVGSFLFVLDPLITCSEARVAGHVRRQDINCTGLSHVGGTACELIPRSSQSGFTILWAVV
jgi:hypothetical protein